MRKTSYGAQKEIVKYLDHCVAVAVSIDKAAFATVAAANEGVIPAGTLLHFDLKNRATKAVPTNDTKLPVGVLRYDVRIDTHDIDAAAAIIAGYVDLEKVTEPTEDEEAALPHVVFIR